MDRGRPYPFVRARVNAQIDAHGLILVDERANPRAVRVQIAAPAAVALLHIDPTAARQKTTRLRGLTRRQPKTKHASISYIMPNLTELPRRLLTSCATADGPLPLHCGHMKAYTCTKRRPCERTVHDTARDAHHARRRAACRPPTPWPPRWAETCCNLRGHQTDERDSATRTRTVAALPAFDDGELMTGPSVSRNQTTHRDAYPAASQTVSCSL